MGKIFEKIKTKKLLILVFTSILSIVYIVLKIYSNKSAITNAPTPTPFTTNKIADFNSIIPNQTSLDRINELLGYPVATKKENNITINEYKTSNKYRTHIINIENDIATFIKQEIVSNEQRVSDIQDIYGLAPHMLYSKSPSASFDLYVYPTNGIAYLGHLDGTILEIWYFPPATIEEFVKNYGEGYDFEPSKIVPLY